MMRPGRPKKTTQLQTNPNATYFIDTVAHSAYASLAMPSANDVIDAMQQKLAHECRKKAALRNDLKKLAEAYHRYVDCEGQLNSSELAIQTLLGLLGEANVKTLADSDEGGVVKGELSASPRPKELRKQMPLWKAMEEYLKVAKEARIGEILIFLDALGIKGATRQAIESARKRHWPLFESRKSGKESFLSLGNVRDIPSAKGE